MTGVREFLEALVAKVGKERAEQELTRILEGCSVSELAALWYDWDRFWARPEQLPPERFRSWGHCGGRGGGKTRTCAEYVVREVMAGRARRVALMAQNEAKTIEVMVLGEAGLLDVSPPWFRAEWKSGRVIWPNGCQAFVYTPEVPGDVRGPSHHLAWLSELVAWPKEHRDEALANVKFSVRLGLAQIVWDTTWKKRHPFVRAMIERTIGSDRHFVVFGRTRDNADNLSADAIEDWEDEFGGTDTAREEMDRPDMREDVAAVLWNKAWIIRGREPEAFDRKVLSLDPAVSMRRSTDATGICLLGASGGTFWVLRDMSGRMAPEVWGALAVETYVSSGCDCVVVERNRGGDLCAANLRACAKDVDWRVEIVETERKTRHRPGVIYVKEVFSHTSKETRADAVLPLYRAGRVRHLEGAELGELESQMLNWEPESGQRSPNALDATVHGLWELAGLWVEGVDGAKAIANAARMAALVPAARVETGGLGGIGVAGGMMAALGRRLGGGRAL